MLNFNHLYYFHIVASEGSFASASEILGVTQPTISEQVKTLERALGEVLFERLPTGLRLTEPGARMFERTKVMFRAGATIHEALAGELQGSTERFRVGVSGVVGRTTTTDFFSPMFDIDARILSIRSGEAHDLLRELRDGGLELVLIESEPPASARTGLEVVSFDRPVLVAVTSPSAKAATDWANLGLVSLRSSTEFRWDVSAYLDARQLRPRIVAEADDVVFLIEAVTRDGYVAFLPHSIARDAIKAGRLKVLATLRGSQATVFAVYRQAPGSSTTQMVVERLIAHVAAQEAGETT